MDQLARTLFLSFLKSTEVSWFLKNSFLTWFETSTLATWILEFSELGPTARKHELAEEGLGAIAERGSSISCSVLYLPRHTRFLIFGWSLTEVFCCPPFQLKKVSWRSTFTSHRMKNFESKYSQIFIHSSLQKLHTMDCGPALNSSLRSTPHLCKAGPNHSINTLSVID